MAMSESRFAELVQDRLVDTDQVREMLGLKSIAGVRHRIDHGWLSGPVLVKERGFSLWDRAQVEREEAARIKAAMASADGRRLRSVPA